MEFAVAILNDHFPTFIERVKLAEAVGFDRICFGDSQSMLRETFVSQAVMARETHDVSLWMTVSNPVTRHPAVMASACASLAELSGNRFVLGLGSGDSALGNIGEKPATVAEMREFIDVLRAMWRGETPQWHGKTIRVVWTKDQVPVSISAEGPKTLHLAGEICDEVCVGSGLDAPSVTDALRRLSIGAAAGNRTIDDVKVWFFAKCNMADSREEAVADIKMALAASANHAFRFSLEGKNVPEEFQGPVRDLQKAYHFAMHEVTGPNPNRELVNDPRLLDFLANRFAIAGTAGEIIDQIEAMEASGVERVFLTAISSDTSGLIERFGREVIPHFKNR